MSSSADTKETVLDPRELLRAVWRRRFYLTIPAILVIIATFAIMFTLPQKYQSEATIFVEDQSIPHQLVPSLTDDYIDRRIDMLTRRVLRDRTLMDIIERYDLYPDLREESFNRALAERMRQDIGVSLLNADVKDPRSGRAGEMTVAFRVSFTYVDPDDARRVTDELVSLFLATNLENRRDVAEETARFFANESMDIEKRIDEIEEKVINFKTNNQEYLPEEIAFARQEVANVEQKINALQRDLRSLKEREGFLQTQVSLTAEFDGGGARGDMTPEAELEIRLAELATAEARYNPTHPDVRRLRREVASLEAMVGRRSGVGEVLDREAALTSQLATLGERYTSEHPDVRRVEQELESVRDAIDEAGGAGRARAGRAVDRNPAFIQLKSQLNSVQTEIATIEQQRVELREQRTELQRRLARAPALEREYNRLMRELENAVADRDILADKETSAQLSRSLELEAVGERLVLGEPPSQPLFPVSPNKKLILAIGLVLSMGSGGVAALLAEMMDRSVRSAADVARLLGDSPLVAVPDIKNTGDRRRTRVTYAVSTVFVMTLLVVGAYFFHHIVTPIDVLASEVERHLTTWLTGVFSRIPSSTSGD